MAVRDEPDRGNRVGFRWDPSYGAVVVTLLGGVAYTVFRLAYALFYGRMGAAPEEVGLGYGQTLVRGVIPALTVGAAVLLALGYLISMALSIADQLPEIVDVIFGFSKRTGDREVLRKLYPVAVSGIERNGLTFRALRILSSEVFSLYARTVRPIRSAPYTAFALPWAVYTGPVLRALKHRLTAAALVVFC